MRLLQIEYAERLNHHYPPKAALRPVTLGLSVPVTVPPNARRRMGIRVWFRYPMVDGARCEVQLHWRLPGLIWQLLDRDTVVSGTRNGLLSNPKGRPFAGVAIHEMPFVRGTEFYWSVSEMTGGLWLYHAHVGG